MDYFTFSLFITFLWLIESFAFSHEKGTFWNSRSDKMKCNCSSTFTTMIKSKKMKKVKKVKNWNQKSLFLLLSSSRTHFHFILLIILVWCAEPKQEPEQARIGIFHLNLKTQFRFGPVTCENKIETARKFIFSQICFCFLWCIQQKMGLTVSWKIYF